MSILYAAAGGVATASDLYTVDPATAALTSIGPIGFALTGLAFDPTTGILYGATSNNSAAHPASLITVDPVTGVGTFIAAFDQANGVNDLTFAADGTLYGWHTSSPHNLYTINKVTAVCTIVGSEGTSYPIEFADGVLYKFRSGDPPGAYSVDTTTAADSFLHDVGVAGSNQNISSMAWNGEAMFFTDSNHGGGNIWTSNLDTWTASLVGDPAPPSGKIDALAWLVPAVATFAELPWRVILTDRDQETISLFDKRSASKQFVFTLNAPATHTGLVASDDVEINRPFPDPDSPATVTNNRRLLFAFRREPRLTDETPPYVCRFGGILMTVEDEGADAPTTRYTAYDPWQLLMSRPARNTDTGEIIGETGQVFEITARASDIATSLLALTEFYDGDDTFIDSTDTGLIEDTDPLGARLTLEQGTSVGEAWQQLCATGTIDIWLEPMYEPITAPGKVCRLHIYNKKAVTQYGEVLSWDSGSRSLTSISRMVDGTRLANVIRYITGFHIAGSDQIDAASIAEFGEYWAQQTFPAGEDPDLVASLAFAQLQLRKKGQKTIQINPAPERAPLALRDYGLGDYVPVWASRNLREPLGIDFQAYFDHPDYDPGAWGYQRIYVIPIDVDDNGVERVPELTTSVDTIS